VAGAGDHAGLEVDLLPGDRPEVSPGEAREQRERDGDLEVVAPGGVEQAAGLVVAGFGAWPRRRRSSAVS